MTFERLLPLGAGIVGVVLVVTTLMKVAAPFAFYRHLARLDLKLPLRVVVPLAIGFEGAWGIALIVRLAPALILPGTIVGFVLLTCLTVWSIKSGKTADCGCYGGFITPSIGQSVALNGAYILLAAVAWVFMPANDGFALWRIMAVVFAGLLTGGTANYALSHEFRTGVAFFTPSPLKVGQRWKSSWGRYADFITESPRIVSYLGPDCPYCQRWVRALNVINESPHFPPVIGIMSSPKDVIDDFVNETGVRFPITTISQTKMQRLATSVPTTVLIEDDVIQEVWNGAQLSQSFSERFKDVFFPMARQRREGSPLTPIG